MRLSEQIKAEIEERFGFFPPFFEPALESPQVLENLWQQTLSGYVNNPLPPLFKEKLFAYLSRFCSVPYCIVCHSCALRPMGMTAGEVLKILEEPAAVVESDLSVELGAIIAEHGPMKVWPKPSSVLEKSLLRSAIFFFLEPGYSKQCRNELRRLLGALNYNYLIEFLCYIKTCHLWVEAHPELSYEADKRAQENLKPLLQEEPRLTEFFSNYNERVRQERNRREEQLAVKVTNLKMMEEILQKVHRKLEILVQERTIKLSRANAELSALYKVSSAISQTINLDELFAIVLDTITGLEMLNVEQKGGIFIVEGERMRLVSHLGHSEEFLNFHKDMKVGDCLCGLAAKTGEIIISKSSEKDSRHTITYPDITPHGHIIVPLKVRDRVVGVLYLYLPVDFDIDEHKLEMLLTIGNQIGIAIDNARLYEETKRFSLHDPLTGLANRRLMEVVLQRSFARAKRLESPFSSIMLDIDYFKKYNDTYGHVVGDKLLVEIAKATLKETRGIDLVVRYGGEEFLILLPETELRRAYEVAERIRRVVEEKTDITISLGVSSFHKGMLNKEYLVKKADEALYKAKQKGRNRVEISE